MIGRLLSAPTFRPWFYLWQSQHFLQLPVFCSDMPSLFFWHFSNFISTTFRSIVTQSTDTHLNVWFRTAYVLTQEPAPGEKPSSRQLLECCEYSENAGPHCWLWHWSLSRSPWLSPLSSESCQQSDGKVTANTFSNTRSRKQWDINIPDSQL